MSDNLGNHTATQDLNMNGFSILNAGGVEANSFTGNGDALTITSSFTGNLAAETGLTLLELAAAVDALSLTSAVTNTYNTFHVPFTYMDMSKLYTSGAIGWVVERNNTGGYLYTCGGYESASASFQSGNAYIDIATPSSATGFAPTGFSVTLVGSQTGVVDCKLDINLYTTNSVGASSNRVYAQTSIGMTTANVPQVVNVVPTGVFAAGRLVAELVFYSKNSKSIKVLGGNANFLI